MKKDKTPNINIRVFSSKYSAPVLNVEGTFIDDLLEHDRDALIKIIGTEIVEEIEKIKK